MKSAQAMGLVKAGKNPISAAVTVGLQASAVSARFKKGLSQSTRVCSCGDVPVNADGKYQ